VRVVLALAALDQYDALPTSIRSRVHELFRRLKSWPMVSGVKALRSALAGQYRMRTADYRLQFRVERDRIVVLKVGHRDGFYDD
jgi:mRNA-degrading endonuclease RelE of RelBE toxin-antitoxin system